MAKNAKKNGKVTKKQAIPKIMGWRRENGRVGVRNHVIVLPLDDLSNAAAEGVANNIKGVMAIPHAYGRLQFGEDLQLFFRTLIGTGANPECRGRGRDRHRRGLDQARRRRNQEDGQAGHRLRHRRHRRHHDDRQGLARRRRTICNGRPS